MELWLSLYRKTMHYAVGLCPSIMQHVHKVSVRITSQWVPFNSDPLTRTVSSLLHSWGLPVSVFSCLCMYLHGCASTWNLEVYHWVCDSHQAQGDGRCFFFLLLHVVHTFLQGWAQNDFQMHIVFLPFINSTQKLWWCSTASCFYKVNSFHKIQTFFWQDNIWSGSNTFNICPRLLQRVCVCFSVVVLLQ